MLTQDFIPNPGGIAVFLHNLCTQLCRLGHQVDVLTPIREDCGEADAEQPYSVYRYASLRRLSSIAPFRRMLTMHRRHRYHVVFIGHFMTTHALGVLALHSLWGTPYVLLCHGNDLYYSINNAMDKLVAYFLLRKASLILGNSDATTQRIQEKGYRGPVEILHPGVDPSEFRPDLEPLAVSQKFNLDGRKVLLSVSRLVKRKGHERVLRALLAVIKKIPNVLYLIVGCGEEEVSLRRTVEELGLRDYVVFAGYVEQTLLPFLYCASDLFVMPSFSRDDGRDYEGFGIAFIEANACGLPVIGGRSGGIEDAVVDGETGLLVDPHNVDEIGAAVIHLLTDVEYAKRLGEYGRRRVEEKLCWEKIGKRLDQYLHSVIEDIRQPDE